eukprot:Clim_evm1s41 gene=Clim_evmTU1s41
MMSTGSILLAVAGVTLVHAAFSAEQYRKYLQAIDEEFVALPSDIVVQSLIGLLLGMVGAVLSLPQLASIDPKTPPNKTSTDENSSTPSFNVFSHRGRNMFSSMK